MAVFAKTPVWKRSIVKVRISQVFEMMTYLRYCYLERDEDDILLKEFYIDHSNLLEKYYGNFEYGSQFAECVLGLGEDHSIDAFFHYLNEVSKEEFLFYLLGRYIPLDQLSDILFHNPHPTVQIERMIKEMDGLVNPEQLAFVENYEAYSQELFKLWKDFYDAYFIQKSSTLEESWRKVNKQLELDLKTNSLDDVISKLLVGYDLPKQFPSKETEDIYLYPSFSVSPKFMIIWGLGQLHIVYNAFLYANNLDQNHQLIEKIHDETMLEDISDFSKSLSEIIRLQILLLIAKTSKIKAQLIAQELDISTATVSRHLSTLKQNKIILEQKEMGCNIYQINKDAFEDYFQCIRRLVIK